MFRWDAGGCYFSVIVRSFSVEVNELTMKMVRLKLSRFGTLILSSLTILVNTFARNYLENECTAAIQPFLKQLTVN